MIGLEDAVGEKGVGEAEVLEGRLADVVGKSDMVSESR
jgi:hypothetical protein